MSRTHAADQDICQIWDTKSGQICSFKIFQAVRLLENFSCCRPGSRSAALIHFVAAILAARLGLTFANTATLGKVPPRHFGPQCPPNQAKLRDLVAGGNGRGQASRSTGAPSCPFVCFFVCHPTFVWFFAFLSFLL